MKFSLPFTLILMLLWGCSLGTQEIVASDFELAEEVAVTFKVLIPEGTGFEQSIVFSLLDPLSGEEINPKHFPMEAEGERSFSVTISVVPGSLLSYRYAREANGLVREADASGEAIQRRYYFVDGPGHVATDVIANWQDEATTLEVGSVRGIVRDADTNEAIPNVTVSASGRQTRSNQDGEFILSGLLQGLHTIVAFSETGEYLSFQQGALVAAGLETPASIAMQASELIQVNFLLDVPEDHVPGIPVYLIGNLGKQTVLNPNEQNAEGQFLYTAELPTGIDIRYKYSLGDGFWNAEHLLNGDYLVRQLLLSTEMDGLVIRDKVASWEAGNSAPIWFEVQSPDPNNNNAYIQFKFSDWTAAIQMWGLGNGIFAYKLNSPTNFAAPLEYRYCQDAFCLSPEASVDNRSVIGNMEFVQYIEDQVEGWK